jgi:hypothetical protein
VSAPGVSDHALLRLLERGGLFEIEQLRAALGESLRRAHEAARSITTSDYVIKADGLVYVVRGETITTVIEDGRYVAPDALRPGSRRTA